MIEVKFQTSLKTAELMSSFKALLPHVLVGVASNVRDLFVKTAQERLKTSRMDFIRSLTEVVSDADAAQFSLVGSLAHLIDRGTQGFDLRTILLKGRDHRVIPFRHTGVETQGTLGQPFGHPLAKKLGAAAAREFGEFIQAKARKLKPGDRLPKVLEGRPTDIYAGLRNESAKKTAPRYMTFRTITKDSSKGNWMYPATEGKGIVAEVERQIPGVADKIVRAMLAGYLHP